MARMTREEIERKADKGGYFLYKCKRCGTTIKVYPSSVRGTPSPEDVKWHKCEPGIFGVAVLVEAHGIAALDFGAIS
jgi:hypothetical protein